MLLCKYKNLTHKTFISYIYKQEKNYRLLAQLILDSFQLIEFG